MKTGYLDRLFNVWAKTGYALQNYAAQRYEGDTVYFRAQDKNIASEELNNAPEILEILKKNFVYDQVPGWQQYMPTSTTVYDVPGDHWSMLNKPHVEVLAEKVNRCLNKL